MKVEILNNADLGRGHARLKLTFGSDDHQRPAPEDQFLIAVQEFPARTFLQPPGQDRWPTEGGECFHQPDAQSWDGDQLILELGPTFTEAFRSKLHAFHVKGSDCVFPNLRLSTAHIDRAPASGDGINVGLPPKADKTPPPVEEPAVEEPPLEEAPVEKPEVPQAPPPEPGGGSGQKILIIIAILLVLLAGMAAVWYFLLRDKSSDLDPSDLLSALTQPETPATPEAEPVPEAEPSPEAASPVVDPLTETRTLLRNQAPLTELEAVLVRLESTAGAEDAVFLLVETLSSSKPEHRTRYGAFFDPADSRPSGSIIKDPQMAYVEYEAAKNAGDPAAAQKQATLVEWAKANAQDNEDAQTFLNSLPEQR